MDWWVPLGPQPLLRTFIWCLFWVSVDLSRIALGIKYNTEASAFYFLVSLLSPKKKSNIHSLPDVLAKIHVLD